jgi:transposase InsO family protein
MGVDIVRPMPTEKGNCIFLMVAVDYFTKWAEAEPLMTITTGAIKNFLWKMIICRFGIPYALVTDNGTQFDCKPFHHWCAELKIRHFFSSVYYPQSNGQVEATNKTLVKILKKKLPKRKGGWVEYLLEVMWSYRTTTSSATSETPYSLAFGVEAVIPVEIGSPSFRIQHYNPRFNSEGLKLHLDLLEEKREEVRVRTSAYKAKAARYYNKKVKP